MAIAYRPLDYGRFHIPEHMKGGLDRYVRLGIRPGGFLQAVLRNDFVEAMIRADMQNKQHLHEYALLLLGGVIPDEAWGSAEAVNSWIKNGGEGGHPQQEHQKPTGSLT